MPETSLMSAEEMQRAIARMAHEVVEKNTACEALVFVGVHTRGVPLAFRVGALVKQFRNLDVPVGALDIGRHRDDLSLLHNKPACQPTVIPTNVTGKDVILFDDVLFTGRSARAAIDALIDFGRPRSIQLAVLIDRGHREIPIKANFVGKNIASNTHDRVQVLLRETDGKDAVVLVDNAGPKNTQAQRSGNAHAG